MFVNFNLKIDSCIGLLLFLFFYVPSFSFSLIYSVSCLYFLLFLASASFALFCFPLFPLLFCLTDLSHFGVCTSFLTTAHIAAILGLQHSQCIHVTSFLYLACHCAWLTVFWTLRWAYEQTDRQTWQLFASLKPTIEAVSWVALS
jgi:hypothetical protein